MQPHTNATIGAWSLGTTGLERPDARTSFELVGSNTVVPVAEDAPRPENPIDAARAWLADPARRAVLAPSLVARAEASVLVAERFYLEIDAMAQEMAAVAVMDGSGDLDPDALERIEGMVSVLGRYSERMRVLLDVEAPPVDADERLNAALAASRVGGLPAFVEAL